MGLSLQCMVNNSSLLHKQDTKKDEAFIPLLGNK